MLADLFGYSIRVRLLDTLISLPPNDFTPQQLAKAAGVPYKTAQNQLRWLKKENLIVPAEKRGKYRINYDDKRLQIASYVDSALNLISKPDTPELVRQRLVELVEDKC